MSSLLFGGEQMPATTQGAPSTPPAPPVPPRPPGSSPGAPQRNQTLAVIAGVGVLLLAMGVGILIGRAGNSKQTTAPPEVITVASGGAGTSTAPASSETPFTSSWPTGTSGYTVQLQTLAESGTSVSTVESDKTADTAKGAGSVGALKSEEFTSLTAGSYVIYSGVYHKRPEAEKALAGLRKKFPGAKVIKISNGSAGSSGAGSGSSGSGSSGNSNAPGASQKTPAPASVLNTLKGAKGKNYEEKSKALPNVVETG
jgi:hypothetical protein